MQILKKGEKTLSTSIKQFPNPQTKTIFVKGHNDILDKIPLAGSCEM